MAPSSLLQITSAGQVLRRADCWGGLGLPAQHVRKDEQGHDGDVAFDDVQELSTLSLPQVIFLKTYCNTKKQTNPNLTSALEQAWGGGVRWWA